MELLNKRSSRVYTAEFKEEALRLSGSVGYSEAARRLGMPTSTLHEWRHQFPLDKPNRTVKPTLGVKRSVDEVEAELRALKKVNASLQLDNEILKKAAAYFARGLR